MSTSYAISCPLCQSLSPTLKLYISHLRLVHQTDPKFNITCGIGGCTKTFVTFPAYNSHVYRCHRSALGLELKYDIHKDCPPPNTAAEPSQHQHVSLVPDYDEDVHVHSQSASSGANDVSQLFDEDMMSLEHAKFLLMLREEKQVSQIAITEIVRKCRSLCEQTFRSTADKVKRTLSKARIDVNDIAGLNGVLDGSAPDYFHGIDTSYLLEEFAKRHMNYVVSIKDMACIY